MRSLIILALSMLLALGFCSPTLGQEIEEKICPVKDHLDVDNVEQCFKCHMAGTFKVRKVNPLDRYLLPDITGVKISYNDNDDLTFYYVLGDINDGAIFTVIKWLDWHPEIINLIVEIQSPGGSLLNAWRVIGLLEAWKIRGTGRSIETRVNGLAASAGLLIFMVGNIRSASPTAELMWHEVSMTGYGFHRSTSSNTTEKAKTLSHLQNTATEYISSRCGMTQEQLLDAIRDGKEFWINGKEAKELGVATKLLWGNNQ